MTLSMVGRSARNLVACCFATALTMAGPGCSSAVPESAGKDSLDLGTVEANATVRFVVDEGVTGFTLVLSTPTPQTKPKLTRLTGPSGPVVVDGNVADKPLLARGATLTAFAPEKGATSVAGEWEAVVASGGNVSLELRRGPPKPTSRPSLSLEVLVPQGAKLGADGAVVGDAETMKQDARFQSVLNVAFEMLEREAGIVRGPIRYVPAPSAAARIEVAFGAVSPTPLEAAIALLPPRTSGVRLLLVDDAGKGLPVLGVSPVRGCSSKDDALALLLDASTKPERAGAVLAHELGHYLGLFHTSDILTVLGHDPIADTPECDALITSSPNACPDRPNLMFPTIDGRPEKPVLSAEQRRIVLGSPALTWTDE